MIKNLFVCYRALMQDGTYTDNNIVMTNVRLLATMGDIDLLQKNLEEFLKVKQVRVICFQRMETTPPKATK